MHGRCRGYYDAKYYHDRGLRVCEEWADFEVFRDWAMANGYAADLTIDRVDNYRGYEPGNCRWVTWAVQRNNTRRHQDAAENQGRVATS